MTKQRNAADGRELNVTLTEAGLAALQRAYPIHLRSVRTRVLDHVDRTTLPCFSGAVIASPSRSSSPLSQANQDQTKYQRPQISPDRARRPRTLEPL